MSALYPNNPYVNPYLTVLNQLVPPVVQPQPMSPPIVHADIIPVNSEEEVNNWAVGNGQTLVFMLRDESRIMFKTGSANGNRIEYYDRRAPQPATEGPEYVTKEELRAMINEMKTNSGGETS